MRARGKGSGTLSRFFESLQDGIGQAIAALAVEREDFAKERTDMIGEVLFEQAARTTQPGFDGLGFDAKQRPGLGDAHAFDRTRDENGAKFFRQFIDGAFNCGWAILETLG